ncbi:MAG: hypothetical protein HW389_898 [Bacteroidetes bacterium]|nr:hypothetical protein [Bacteroidota bacterium]
MDDFLSMLEKDPTQLPKLVAEYETWRGPLKPSTEATGAELSLRTPKLVRKLERLRLVTARAGNGSSSSSSSTGKTSSKSNGTMLKLYQPAHQRYYLVTTCLVCGITGMPDRKIDPGREERASFVIRRLFPEEKIDTESRYPEYDAETWEEYAYISVSGRTQWKRVGRTSDADTATLQPGEDRLPLFGVSCLEDDDRTRRLITGLVPVGKREAYMAAPVQSPDEGARSVDEPLPKTARKILFRSQVAEPWKNVIDQSGRFKTILTTDSDPDPEPEETDSLVKGAREQIQTQSWLVLLDFALFLEQYVTDVWGAIVDPTKEASLADSAQTDLMSALKSIKPTSDLKSALTSSWLDLDGETVPSPYVSDDIEPSLLDALKASYDAKDTIESATGSYERQTKGDPWPEFLFPLADPVESAITLHDGVSVFSSAVDSGEEVEVSEEEAADVASTKDDIDTLVALVIRAMPTDTEEPVPPIPLAAQEAVEMREGIFVIRAVFERPNCAPFKTTVLSQPTVPFKMAGFFDPDAPARPIRIALPIDTTPAGLRKFDKNTAFMISDVLCGQIQRAKGLSLGDLVRSVLPWPFHKDLSVPDTGPCKSTSDPALQLGMICSLSIPIITICALILLMIVVSILDYIFRWIPYLIMCFPLPGFKAKKD